MASTLAAAGASVALTTRK
ncbi:hypothetical protein ACIGDI_42030 [Streptomyces sp. NPDC085900]